MIQCVTLEIPKEMKKCNFYWVAKKSCHGQTLINECSISDYPSNFEDLYLALHAILFQKAFCFAFL